MANPQHLDILKETHCSGIDFSVVDMRDVDVHEVYLVETSSYVGVRDTEQATPIHEGLVQRGQ